MQSHLLSFEDKNIDVKETEKGNVFDLAFIGGGTSVIFGLLFSRHLSQLHHKKILIIEAGPDIDEREKDSTKHRLYGIGGAGAFSDFKLDLGDLVGYDANELTAIVYNTWENFIRFADFEISYRSGEDFYPSQLIERLTAEKIYLSKISWAHFGSKKGSELVKKAVQKLRQEFSDNLEIWTNSAAIDIDLIDSNNLFRIKLSDGREVISRRVIVAVGRSGHSFTKTLFRKYKEIKYKPNNTDIGVRVEFPSYLSEPYRKFFYDPKLVYYSSQFDDKIRVFCANLFDGEVVEERYLEKYISVNGHSDPTTKKTGLSNFAILASYRFDTQIRDVNDWTLSIVEMANNLADGKPIVQRIKDLLSGRKSTAERLSELLFSPSLKSAYPGDLSLVLPYRVLSGIIEFIKKLDKVLFPGLMDIGILYGVEAKFYGYKVLDSIEGLYFVGDCSGWTRGILGATAHMVKTLSEIVEN